MNHEDKKEWAIRPSVVFCLQMERGQREQSRRSPQGAAGEVKTTELVFQSGDPAAVNWAVITAWNVAQRLAVIYCLACKCSQTQTVHPSSEELDLHPDGFVLLFAPHGASTPSACFLVKSLKIHLHTPNTHRPTFTHRKRQGLHQHFNPFGFNTFMRKTELPNTKTNNKKPLKYFFSY